jgi:hypothetical protein
VGNDRGEKFEFKAAFNETNIYTLPASEQADSNKLFGFSDCKTLAQESSARFGWRWYNNRLEILAVSHYDGRWHLHEIVGVAELNKVYDFKIELSQDKTQYIFTFNNSNPISMKRDCSDDTMLDYYLYPYFGGSEKSPRDMVVSVWEDPHANFALQKVGPNPLKAGDPLNLQMLVGEPMDIKFELFDMLGRQVYRTESIHFDSSDESQQYTLNIPGHFSSGMYLLRLMGMLNPFPMPGYVVGGGRRCIQVNLLKIIFEQHRCI